jgi:hypothetical protein
MRRRSRVRAPGAQVGCRHVLRPDRPAGSDGGSRDASETAADASLVTPDAAAPDASPDAGPPGPHFFVHLSDVHIDSGSFAAPSFDYVLDTVLPSFPGIPVLVTGDLVEAGHQVSSWEYYRDKTEAAGLSPETYVECAGNHDSLLDGELENYLSYSVAGRSGRGLHEVYYFERYGQRVRVITTNTADAGDPVRDGAGFITNGQIDDIIAGLDDGTGEPFATLVLGHHPKDSPDGLELLGTDDNMERLLDAAHATAYVFGHSHVHLNYWDGTILQTMAATSGNPGDGTFTDWVDPGFSLIAIDDGPSEISIPILGLPPEPLSSPWPAVMITRPANRDFGAVPGLSAGNPLARPLPRARSANLLQAGAFAPGGVDAVTYQVDDGPELPMEAVDGYYRAWFATPDADECTITVRAVAGATSSTQSVTVSLVAE